PQDLCKLVAVGDTVIGAGPSGVFVSDGGAAPWRAVREGASALAAGDGVVYAAAGRSVARSDDGGTTWSALPALPIPADAGEPVIATAAALGVAPDGAVWAGLDCSWLSFYAVDQGGPTPMMHPAGRRHGAVHRA